MPWGDHNKGQGPWGGGNQPPRQEQPDINELIRKGKERLSRTMGGGNGGSGEGNGGGAGGGIPIQGVLALGIVGFFVWLSTGIYQIDPDEQGVVMRFGAYESTVGEGLHYHLPAPIERVIKAPVTQINRMEVGFRTTGADRPDASSKVKLQEESLMLTGDENIVDVDFEVQWRIGDAGKFLFRVKNPEGTIKSAAESAMREVVGRTNIAKALTEARGEIQQETKQILQSLLDSYNAGILVERVNLREVQPPQQVIGAFRDVQNAKADKEAAINQAETYRNDIIPKARGEAAKIVQGAEAYREEVVALAKGEADRFVKVYDEFKKAKSVTKQRMYLEAMESILKGMDKIILDKDAARGTLPYLPLNELRKEKTNG